MSLSRRELLRTLPIAALAGRATSAARAEDDRTGMIVRMQEPRNLESPLAGLASNITATEMFYIRSHFAVPAVDPKTFKLTIEGHVEKELELSLDELKQMKSQTVSREITLECAGNGRVFLVPQARGLQWGNGAVGNAKWTGVPLGAILERAKVKTGAVDVVLMGADKGSIAEPATPGAIHFDRGIPLAKATKDETLLAWDMNDRPLTASHGAPLRAVVGGWYGMASVKWLTRIVVTDKPHAGFWQTFDYSIWDRAGASPQLVPVSAMQPKAIVTTLGPNAAPPAGPLPISGMAWAGENAVAKVEISLDGGKTWSAAKLGDKGRPFAWTPWTATFTPGRPTILVRCHDDKGRMQPEKRDPDRRTYMINHLVPVEVSVN